MKTKTQTTPKEKILADVQLLFSSTILKLVDITRGIEKPVTKPKNTPNCTPLLTDIDNNPTNKPINTPNPMAFNTP